MSVVPIRCPTCGSAAASTAKPDEYVCKHCSTRFQITQPSAMLISDTKTHNCPSCGRPVSALQSFRCTECGRLDFCQRCVTAIPIQRGAERFVCRTCIMKKGLACSDCGDYGATVCFFCSRRACQKHVANLFGLYVSEDDETYYASCPTCRGTICNSCVQIKKRFFSTKVQCKKCGTELSLSPQQLFSCKFCGTTLPSNAAFCPKCGRSWV